MAEAPLLAGLPDEIVVWEILVRLPPKSLLRCRAVSPAWRSATSSRQFLLAHHARQPCLPLVWAFECGGDGHEHILSFDHRAADGQLQPVAQIEYTFSPRASCDGLLILYDYNHIPTDTCYSICNLATREHAPLRQLSGFRVSAMYAHRPTGDYKLLLYQIPADQVREPGGEVACYVFTLGSNQPPRYIAAAPIFWCNHALLRDSLHWYPMLHLIDPPQRLPTRSKVLTVFDTMSESFRQMRAPYEFPASANIFEMDSTLGIYTCGSDLGIVNIWVLQNYEAEVWEKNYSVKLPAAEIRGQFQRLDDNWSSTVVSVDGDVLLMVTYGRRLFYIDTDGKLVANFHCDGQEFHACRSRLRLKQSLVPHTFLTALEDYSVNALPFV